MDEYEVLRRAIGNPEIVESIVGDYEGRMSLGIRKEGQEFVLALTVEGDDVSGFPRAIKVHGGDVSYTVRVVVEGNLEPFFPLSRSDAIQAAHKR